MSSGRIIVKKKQANLMEIEIEGEDHTIGNMLARELLETPGVREAYYRIEHPLKNTVTIFVRTDGSLDPLDALKNAVATLRTKIAEVNKTLEKALGKK